jgi:hypothetical protein
MKVGRGLRNFGYATLLTGFIGILSLSVYMYPRVYRTFKQASALKELQDYKMKNLDEKAVRLKRIPSRLHSNYSLFDADGDGDYESYLFWDNHHGPSRYLLMEKGKWWSVTFPELSEHAVPPTEKIEPFDVDYHQIGGKGKVESIIYRDSYILYPEENNYVYIESAPMILGFEDGTYFWSDIE